MTRGPKTQGIQFFCPGCGTPRPTVGSPCVGDCLGAHLRLSPWSWTDLGWGPRPALVLDRNVYHVNTKTSAFSISGSVPATPTRGAYDAAAVGASSAASTPQARVWRSAATEALWSLIVSEQPFTADDVWAAFDARCYRLFVDGATTHLNGYVTPWDDFKDDPTALRRPKYEFGATTGLGSLVKRMSKSGWLVQMGTLRSKNPASHSAMVRVWMGNAPTTPLSITV